MMSLKDYLESMEDLPGEFRDMLVTIRELDLTVQNALDKKTEESEEFLHKAGKMKPEKRESVYQSLKADYAKILEDADEKVNVAEKLANILVNSLAQLDREIAELKIQLETVNPGITSSIEEKIAKTEVPVNEGSGKTVKQKKKKSKKSKKSRKKSSGSWSTVSSINEELPTKEVTPTILESVQEKENVVDNNVAEIPVKVEPTVLPRVETIYDPTPYCICNQVAYGEMIACDNPSCPDEWFHYACVDLTTAPEGTWYCPKCNNVSKVSSQKK